MIFIEIHKLPATARRRFDGIATQSRGKNRSGKKRSLPAAF
jgi:hypothetical protein